MPGNTITIVRSYQNTKRTLFSRPEWYARHMVTRKITHPLGLISEMKFLSKTAGRRGGKYPSETSMVALPWRHLQSSPQGSRPWGLHSHRGQKSASSNQSQILGLCTLLCSLAVRTAFANNLVGIDFWLGIFRVVHEPRKIRCNVAPIQAMNPSRCIYHHFGRAYDTWHIPHVVTRVHTPHIPGTKFPSRTSPKQAGGEGRQHIQQKMAVLGKKNLVEIFSTVDTSIARHLLSLPPPPP